MPVDVDAVVRMRLTGQSSSVMCTIHVEAVSMLYVVCFMVHMLYVSWWLMVVLQIHWLSIINSMVLVFLLIAFVIVILVSKDHCR